MTLTTQAVGPKVLWLARHEPEIFSKAARIVGCPTYLVQRLTGACVVDHYGAANYAPFYDVEKLAWDRAQGDTVATFKAKMTAVFDNMGLYVDQTDDIRWSDHNANADVLHYKVAGSVPEPVSAGLLIAGAVLLRALGRRKMG